jgi:hypothetical protein
VTFWIALFFVGFHYSVAVSANWVMSKSQSSEEKSFYGTRYWDLDSLKVSGVTREINEMIVGGFLYHKTGGDW